VSYSVEVSWLFVLGELAPYIFVLLFAIGMLISRRRRLSKEHKEESEQKTAEEEQKLTEIAMEEEFGKLDDKIVVVDESYFEEDP
jgi:ABC-type multidrug transport system fused ATPase/permease subunit